ncbi:protein of unknown function [Streptococcus thermophilus]|nr:protein of unknown function [Streptococcus thermophilus]
MSDYPLNNQILHQCYKYNPFGDNGSIISVVGKTTVEIIELFECTQKAL